MPATTLFTFQRLYKAYLDCRRHKRKTHHAAKFEINFESELLKLEEELRNRTYRPGRSICFVVEEPTLREVFAAPFRDRVVHHLLYDFLEPVFEPKFIAQSYACRKSKGTHQSLNDLRGYLLKATRNHRRRAYFLHLDIRAFFTSLNKDVLYGLLAKRVKNPELLWLARIIVFNDPVRNFTTKGDKRLFAKIPSHKSLFTVPEDQGLPIGNLTSQFFANVYLDELDQFVKHRLKARWYLRYVDDMLFLSEDPCQLKAWRDEISLFLKERLRVELNHRKQILQAAHKGIDWLGYIVKPHCVLVRRRIVHNLKRKLASYNRLLGQYFPGETDTGNRGQLRFSFPEYGPPLDLVGQMLATVNSYYGHFSHADTFKLRKHLWENHFGLLRECLEPSGTDYSHFLIPEARQKAVAKLRRAGERA